MENEKFGKSHTAAEFHDATNALHQRREAQRAEAGPKKPSGRRSPQDFPRRTTERGDPRPPPEGRPGHETAEHEH